MERGKYKTEFIYFYFDSLIRILFCFHTFFKPEMYLFLRDGNLFSKDMFLLSILFRFIVKEHIFGKNIYLIYCHLFYLFFVIC